MLPLLSEANKSMILFWLMFTLPSIEVYHYFIVSLVRGSPYYYCQNLSDFAKVRFSTMVTDYRINHYGFDQDFDRVYGTIHNTYFEEEVPYPSGYTPKSYISELETTTPLTLECTGKQNFCILWL